MERLDLTQRHIHREERLAASPREGQELESGLGLRILGRFSLGGGARGNLLAVRAGGNCTNECV